MIVKNEAEVIERCLASILPLIDYWVIVDTGSTDGTQETIQRFLKNVPGELHERAWMNFGHNRNEALILAKNKGDYLLFMDADDLLLFSKDFHLPDLTLDFYACYSEEATQRSLLPRLIKTSSPWKWVGALHEVILPDRESQGAILEGVVYKYCHDGARSKDPKTLEKDAAILESAILENPKESRNFFYLAKTYEMLGDLHKALSVFKERIAMSGFAEEVFLSKLAVAKIELSLGHFSPESFLDAYLYRPTRIEPIYYLVEEYIKRGNYEKGFLMTKTLLEENLSSADEVFVEDWIYRFGILAQYAFCAEKTDRGSEALKAYQSLIKRIDLPPTLQKSIEESFLRLTQQKNEIIQADLKGLLKEKL